MNQNERQPMTTAMMNMKFLSSLAILCVFALASNSALKAVSAHAELLGDWSLDLESGEPAWMSVVEKDGRPLVHMRVYIGPDGPYSVTEAANGRLKFWDLYTIVPKAVWGEYLHST